MAERWSANLHRQPDRSAAETHNASRIVGPPADSSAGSASIARSADNGAAITRLRASIDS